MKIMSNLILLFVELVLRRYEVLVVIGQVRLWDRNRRARVGMVCEAGAG